MKTLKIFLFLLLLNPVYRCAAQELNNENVAAIMSEDNTEELTAVLTKDNINACFDGYSFLSQAARYNAVNCAKILLEKGANVNLVCNGYIPPLMHAAKYGHLEVAKLLVAKGADVNYKYEGTITDLKGMTPVGYAERFQRKEVADFLKSVSKK